MSASGILRENNVIFYHPLDDFTEYTQNQTWTGSGMFVPAKIINGIAGVFSPNITWESEVEFFSSDGAIEPVIARLNDTQVVVVYRDGGNLISSRTWAHVGTITGDTIVWASGYEVISSFGAGLVTLNAVCRVADDKFAIAFKDPLFSDQQQAVIASISGTTISFGTPVSFQTLNNSNFDITSPDESHIVVVYQTATSGSAGNSRIGSISGTSLTFETITNFREDGISNVFVERLDDTHVVAAYRDTNPDGAGSVVVGAISGTTITWGSGIQFVANTLQSFSVLPLGSTKFGIIWTDAGTQLNAKVGEVSGTTISLGSIATLADGITLAFLRAHEIDSDHFICAFPNASNSNRPTVSIGSLTTSGTISFGDISLVTTNSVVHTDIVTTDGHKVVIVYEDTTDSNHGTANVGALFVSANIVATSGGAYPSVSGYDRIVLGGWSKNLSHNDTEVTVSKGYSVGIASGSISLGSGVWNGSGLVDFLTSINDGSGHLFVLDFHNDTGDDWILNTSLDGSGFINHGVQSSGSQPIILVESGVQLIAINNAMNHWIDELVLWGGEQDNFSDFSTHELRRLFRLADFAGLTMPLYSTFGEPINDNTTLFLTAHDITSDNITLFSRGIEISTDEIILYLRGPFFLPDVSGVIYYQPNDTDDTEFTKQIQWTNDNVSYIPLIIDQGNFVQTSGRLYSPSGNYSSPDQYTNLTALSWVSGVRFDNTEIQLGWIDNNSILINISGVSGVILGFYASGIRYEFLSQFLLNFEPTLFVARIEQDGANSTGYLSVDGNSFIQMGQVSSAQWDNSGPNIGNKYIQLLSSGMAADETTLWGNIDQFTSLELVQFYVLGSGLQLPLNYYTDILGSGLPVNNNIELYIQGPLPIDESIDLYVQGPIPINDNINLHIHGFDDFNDNFILVETGHESFNNSITLNIHGITNRLVSIYWTDPGSNKIQRSNSNGSKIEDIIDTDLITPLGIDIDSSSRKIYWLDDGISKLQRSNLDGTSIQDLVVSGISGSIGIAIDRTINKIYWTDDTSNVIKRSDFNGSNVETIVSGLENAVSIAIDTINDKVYITNGPSGLGSGLISRFDPDGSNIEIVISGLNSPRGIDVNSRDDQVFWIDDNGNSIHRANSSGILEQILVSGLTDATELSLDINNGKLYWIDQTEAIIRRMNFNGTNIEDIITSGLVSPYGIVVNQRESIVDLSVEIDIFIKSSDHFPQLLGVFSDSVVSVTIEVWDLIDGANILVILVDDICQQIGDTGRWFWSTINLPPHRFGIQQYMYKMSADNGEEFIAEFFIKSAGVNILQHPSDRSKYILGG